MSTIADLPASAKMLSGPQYAWKGSQDSMGNRTETYSWSCPYADSNAFYAALVGTRQTFSFGGATIVRNVPLQHPYNPRLYASSLTWNGINGYGTTPANPFAYVIFNVVFSYPPYNVGSESSGASSSNTGAPPFIEISATASTRTITDTGRQYQYTPSGFGAPATNLQHDVGIAVPGLTYEVTLHAIPDLLAWLSVIAPLNGKVNSQPLVVGGFTRAAGTTLLDGYGYELSQNVLGDAQFTGRFMFNCSSLPWNSYYIGGTAYALTPSPYATADLNAIYM